LTSQGSVSHIADGRWVGEIHALDEQILTAILIHFSSGIPSKAYMH